MTMANPTIDSIVASYPNGQAGFARSGQVVRVTSVAHADSSSVPFTVTATDGAGTTISGVLDLVRSNGPVTMDASVPAGAGSIVVVSPGVWDLTLA